MVLRARLPEGSPSGPRAGQRAGGQTVRRAPPATPRGRADRRRVVAAWRARAGIDRRSAGPAVPVVGAHGPRSNPGSNPGSAAESAVRRHAQGTVTPANGPRARAVLPAGGSATHLTVIAAAPRVELRPGGAGPTGPPATVGHRRAAAVRRSPPARVGRLKNRGADQPPHRGHAGRVAAAPGIGGPTVGRLRLGRAGRWRVAPDLTGVPAASVARPTVAVPTALGPTATTHPPAVASTPAVQGRVARARSAAQPRGGFLGAGTSAPAVDPTRTWIVDRALGARPGSSVTLSCRRRSPRTTSTG